ncbi:MAG: hypothetical protein HY770_01015 [Chitinivibrionia bacterium]|nr:hypothetical protein [Chitinivibrionia bacterium]
MDGALDKRFILFIDISQVVSTRWLAHRETSVMQVFAAVLLEDIQDMAWVISSDV